MKKGKRTYRAEIAVNLCCPACRAVLAVSEDGRYLSCSKPHCACALAAVKFERPKLTLKLVEVEG